MQSAHWGTSLAWTPIIAQNVVVLAAFPIDFDY
jgi:hypothetical protein